MGHKDGGDAELALDGADFLAEADADFCVECRERLVEEEHARPRGESAGERDALLLAPRQLERVALAEAGQADELQHFVDAGAALVGGDAGDPEAEADIVLDVHVREQRIGLEHHSDLALVRWQRRDVLAFDQDGAGVGALEAGDHPQDRGLAAAGGPEQGHELALVEGEADALDDGVAAKGLHQVLEPEEVLSHSGS